MINLTCLCCRSARLKNIEETEKAKRAAADERKEGKRKGGDDEFLAATRCESGRTWQDDTF